MNEATFTVHVDGHDARRFAELSGDWNPLHTDAEHASGTPYGRPVLHGAFSAGLLSRMAGMYLPGRDCLLHGMRLRFLVPIIPPADLVVHGRMAVSAEHAGRVDVAISDARSSIRYVEGTYEFGVHEHGLVPPASRSPVAADLHDRPQVLVTGANGGLGRAVMARLGAGSCGTSRRAETGLLHVPDLEQIAERMNGRVDAIVHCAWPSPDNVQLLGLTDPAAAVEHHLAAPLRQILALARLLGERGTEDAVLVLLGSTAALPGRHNYRMPLYTLAKSLVPKVAQILAVELGSGGRRAVAVVFDVVAAGMNQKLSRAARLAHSDRAPSGMLPSAEEAASQVEWVLANRSFLLSGATITLSGGALP